MRFTLENVVNFCWKHKRNKGFKEHGYEQVGEQIVWAADNGKLLIVADDGGLCGVCVFTKYPDSIYIHHIVGTREGFRTIATEFVRRFSEIPIKGLRNSKLKTYQYKDYGRLCKSFRRTSTEQQVH